MPTPSTGRGEMRRSAGTARRRSEARGVTREIWIETAALLPTPLAEYKRGEQIGRNPEIPPAHRLGRLDTSYLTVCHTDDESEAVQIDLELAGVAPELTFGQPLVKNRENLSEECRWVGHADLPGVATGVSSA